MSTTGAGRNRAWGIAIVSGLAVAAALIVIPRVTFFEPEARDACEETGSEFVGLAAGGGRYADPVPEGARCIGATAPAVIELDFFAASEPLDSILAWLYRLACILLPLAIALLIGARLGRTG